MEKEIGVLYVGGDDSNHAGTSKGEIIVSTFSFLREDSIVNRFKNTRDYQSTVKWLNNENRDYRYSALTSEKYRHSSQNLVEVIPKMVTKYLLEEKLHPGKLNIYLDGRLERGAKQAIRDFLFEYTCIEKIVVDNFIKKNLNKKGRIEKHPLCPAVVYHADVLAPFKHSIHFIPRFNKL